MMSTQKDEIKLAVIQNDIDYIKEKMNIIDTKVSNGYISRAEFDAKFLPVQKVVYGLVGLILIGVVGTMLSLVLK